MKTYGLVFSMIVGANAVLGFMVLPPGAGTNKLATLQASQISAQRFFNSGQLDQLQHQMDMLQIEFSFLTIAFGAAGAAGLLTIRSLREASRAQENHTNQMHTDK